MARVLFISAAIPPFPESHTIRNVFLLRGLHQAGIAVSVLTAQATGGDNSLAAKLPPVQIHRTSPAPFDCVKSRLSALPGGSFMTWAAGVWSNFFAIPDSKFGWERAVVEFTREHADAIGDFDGVIASSSSYTAQMAAARVSQDRQVPYIADLGDPWTYNPIWPATFPYRVVRNRLLEERTIPRARLLTVTTQETAGIYHRWLGVRCPRTVVIPMGFAADDFPDVAGCSAALQPKLTYVGVAYRTGRNLLPVLEAIREIQGERDLEFDVVGPHSRAFPQYVRRFKMRGVRFHGRLEYDRSLEFIKSAGMLLIIGNPKTAQVPGKVFMYLAAGKPIVFVSQNEQENDPSWRILQTFSGTYFCRHDKREIAATLRSVLEYGNRAAREALDRRQDPALAQYEWSEIGRRYGDLVRQELQGG